MRLTENELALIQGGGSGWIYGLVAVIGALVSLVAGFIDGYLNPLKCNMRKAR